MFECSKEEFNKKLQDTKDILTLHDIETLVRILGARNVKSGGEGILIMETICHHKSGGSHKLYYYDSTHNFHCYTDCGDSFDIYGLVIRNRGLNNVGQAYQWVCNQLGIDNYTYGFGQPEFDRAKVIDDWDFIDGLIGGTSKYNKPYIEEIDKNILNMFQKVYYSGWIKEGISIETMKKFDILFCSWKSKVIIPHYDIDGRLIGIRNRTLIEEDAELYGKYTPFMLYEKQFNHPLSLNLYGLYQNKECIKKMKKVMLVESEKGTLQCDTIFKEDNFTLGLCGNNLTDYQVDVLLELGVEEVIIGLDRQYKEVGDDEYKRWAKHIRERLISKLAPYFRVYVLWDTKGYLGYKDSPTDRGKDVLLKLMDEKIYVGTFDEKDAEIIKKNNLDKQRR